MNKTSYDEVIYDSYPYSHTLPSEMATIAKLFGVDAPDFKKCSILELGCAAGGNIIPIAARNPNAKIVGIDLSKTQIDIGLNQISQLNLKNIELKAMSITDINEDFGKFDYIICHGILSWVPKDVQDAIFKVCEENLSKNGLALISYNTLPGWNAVKSVRDIMRFHTKNITDLKEKVEQAIAVLKFVQKGASGHHKEAIEAELKLLDGQQASYLFHDHLEKDNEQFYFSDFMQKAMQYNLQYLGDSSLATMYSGSYSKDVRDTLSCVKNIVQQEQYMDFITNRRFRNTILCHKDVKINRNVDSRVIKEFNICSNLHIDKKPSAKDVVSDKKLVFYMPNNKEINVASTSPAAKAALATLFESKGKYLSYKKIIDLSCKKYSGVRKDDIISFIDTTMINLVMSKMLKISLNDFASLGSKKNLKPCELVSYQVRNQSWLTNVRHEKLNVDLPARVIISLMDGKKDKKALIKATIKEVENGTLSLSDDKGKKVTDLKVVEKIVKSSVENVIEKMVNAGVL